MYEYTGWHYTLNAHYIQNYASIMDILYKLQMILYSVLSYSIHKSICSYFVHWI